MSFSQEEIDKALSHLRRADPVIRRVINRHGPCSMKRSRRYFQSLARAVVAQQISSKAAKSIWNRVQHAARPRPLTADVIASWSQDELRALGVSPQKASYLHDLAERVRSGKLQLNRLSRYPDDQVINELIAVRGIGVWTAQMFLMFSLGRMDVFPHGDLGIRTAIRNLYGLSELPDRQASDPIVRPWRPYTTIACWYLWRTVEDEDTW